MRAIKWQIPFVSLKDTPYIVNIYAEDYEGTPIVLKGDVNPFITEEDDDEDPFMPIRDTSGHINIIVDDVDDVADIYPEGITDRYVELVSNSTIMWMGYIRREVFSSVWDTTPYGLQLPIVSAISILKDMEYSATPAKVDLCVLLKNCIQQTGANFANVYLPADMVSADIQADVVNLAFQPTETKEKEYVIGSDIPEPDMGMTYYEVLEEICKYLGFQLREYRNSIIFSAPDNDNRYHVLTIHDLGFGILSDSDIMTYTDTPLPAMGDVGGTISRSLPMQQVRISTPLDQLSRDLFTINDLKSLTWNESEEKETGYAYYKTEKYLNGLLISAKQYRPAGSVWSGVPLDLVVENWGETSFEDLNFVGGSIVNDTFDKRGGLVPAIILTSSNNTDGIHKFKAVFLETQSIMLDALNVSDLQIWFKTELIGYDDIPLSEHGSMPPFYIQIEHIPQAGDQHKFWDGTLWQNQEAYILITSPSMAFTEVGTVFPAYNGVGSYKITICCFDRTNSDDVKFIRITDVNLSTIISQEQATIEGRYTLDSIERVAVTGAGGMEEYRQEAMLFTNGNLLTKYPNFKVHSTYCGIDGNSHWADILERMATWYGEAREIVETTLHTTPLPLNPGSRITYNGNTYILASQMINWHDAMNTIKIIKI